VLNIYKGLAITILALFISTQGTEAAAQVRIVHRVYKGEDGGFVFMRIADKSFVAFGEHPGGQYAFAARGTVNGNAMQASYWDVPKGRRAQTGAATWRMAGGGKQLSFVSGDDWGPNVLTETPAAAIQWRQSQMRAASFQSGSVADLTGAFEGDEKSRHYVRELGKQVVWVAERAAQPEERPGWVTVFFGERAPGAAQIIRGDWFDVPKGMGGASGAFTAVVRDPTGNSLFSRELALGGLQDGNLLRTRSLVPEYALDYDRFSAEINKAVAGRFVGYGYAIARKGGIIRQGAGGFRRLQQDGEKLPFEPRTSSQAVSFSKTFTAVALAQALRQRNLRFDDRIAPHLPKCWKLGPGMSTMTFADLAGHHSGLDDGDLKSAIVGDDDPYTWARGVIETGRTKTKPTSFDYQNANYGILRYLVTAVGSPVLFQQAFKHRDCDKDGAGINTIVSNLFVNFQTKTVFAPTLAPYDLDVSYEPKGNFALIYDVNDQKKKGLPANPEARLRAGAGYLSASAVDGALFLSNFDDGEIVPLGWAQTMKSERYGFDSWETGKAGRYLWKNGGCPSKTCAAWGMIFPGGVQAYIVVNSSGRPSPSGQNLGEILAASYDKAFR
jgi:CubicO group peptidase (beta-lactamase class C family)